MLTFRPESLLTITGIRTGFCLGLPAILLVLRLAVGAVLSADLTSWLAFIFATLGLFDSLVPLFNWFLSLAIYVELTGIVAAVVVWFRNKERDWRKALRVFRISTVVSVGLALTAFTTWVILELWTILGAALYKGSSEIVLSGKLPQVLFFIVLGVVLIAVLRIVVPLTGDVVPILREFRRLPPLTAEEWELQFGNLGSDEQAMYLRRTSAGSLDLTDSAFLALVRKIEKHIQKEPALSAYWARRNDLEIIDRQQRV